MRRLGNNIEEYKQNIICYIGHVPGKYGVGFLINKKLKPYIESFVGLSDRVASLNLNIEGQKFTIIQVYAPTEAGSESDVDDFYKSIEDALKTAHKNLILMGDFNAKIGHPQKEKSLVMKKFGYGKRNDRGQRLIDFAFENKLTIINTCFKKKPNRRWTWKSPNGSYRNEIDFILSNQINIFQNIETINLNYPSDHRPLRATIQLKKQKKSRANYTKNHKIVLKSENAISKYKEILSTKLLNVETTDMSVQTYYDNLINIITDSLKRAHKVDQTKKTDKILSEQTKQLLTRRKELQRMKNKTRGAKNEISALYKLVNKYIKRDYAKYRQFFFNRKIPRTKR
ncbi:unnamed protein product [Leptosia nina]|uniref:Endonuclease/exonuclease/phosphatase domain-containing protein n=1 Tax=Leptosia nina TaxID=320188 RepID=A0AAV1K646_9NEOP